MVGMILPSDIETVDDALRWVREAAEVTPYGTVGITLQMQDGVILFARPEWSPTVKITKKETP